MSHQHFTTFDAEGDQLTVNQRWHLWIERFENFLIVSSVSGANKKKAMLLHYAGESVFEMYKEMESYDPNDNYDDVKRKLNEHFEINKNADVLRMNFRRAVQFEEERLDEFHSRLKKLAKHCTFENLTSEIREQIIQNCYFSRLRRKILEMKVEERTLKNILDLGRRLEIAQRDCTDIEKKKNVCVSQVRHKISRADNKQMKCFKCGGKYPHPGGRTKCFAHGKQCFNCGKIGHFKSQCRHQKNKVHNVDNNEEDSDSSHTISSIQETD